jgi:hypothetical protein
MAKITEITLTAAHEVGHLIVAQNHGIKVFEIRIEPGGDGGYTDIDEYVDYLNVAMEIALAGFVAEELAKGNDPIKEIDHFFTDYQYADDCADLMDVLDHLEDEFTIHDILVSLVKQLTKPRVVQTSKRMVRRLARHKKLTINAE